MAASLRRMQAAFMRRARRLLVCILNDNGGNLMGMFPPVPGEAPAGSGA